MGSIFEAWVRRGLLIGWLVGGVMLATGCGPQAAKLDLAEIQDPLIRKAKAKQDQGDYEGALRSLRQALDKRPRLAQAHLDTGLLYDNYKKDYLAAIYHYQRYLELRPDTEKKGMLEDLIRKAKMSYVASFADQLPGHADTFRSLKEENLRLKKDLQVVRANLAQQMLPPAGRAGAAAPGSQHTGGELGSSLYRVQPNETLSAIAAKVYQDPNEWSKIFEANRGSLASPEKLRVGQELIIPQ